MSEERKPPAGRRKPGAAPRRRRSAEPADTPKPKPHSYGQAAELSETPNTDPRIVETPRKPVAETQPPDA